MPDQRMTISESAAPLPTSPRGEEVPAASVVVLITVLLASVAAPVAAQQATPAARPASTESTAARAEDSTPIEDPKLIFEREVFVYPTENRRDPFEPLGKEGMGPMFEELSLRMIIFSEAPGQSVAVLADGSKRSYRLRRGETLGNATIVGISPVRAVFVVEDYGNRRREILDLRPITEPEGS